MNCHFTPHLCAWLEGTLPPEKEFALFLHMNAEVCEGCLAFFEDNPEEIAFQLELASLISESKEEPQPSLERKVESAQTDSSPSFWSTLKAFLWVLHAQGWGSGGLVVAGFILILWQFPSAPPIPPDPGRTAGYQDPGLLSPPLQRDRVMKGVAIELVYSRCPSGPNSCPPKSFRAAGPVSLSHGDRILISYRFDSPMHVILVGFNQKERGFVLAPEKGKESILCQGKGSFPTNSGYELDNFVGAEKYFVLWSKTSFSTKDVLQELRDRYKKANKDIEKIDLHGLRWSYRSFIIHKKVRESQPMKRE